MRTADWNLLASYVGLLSLAIGSIYAGSFGSLPTDKDQTAKAEDDATRGEDSDDEEEVLERLHSGDAWLFPIFGSVALFGLYLVIKYVGQEWLNWFLGWYFAFMGIGSVWKCLVSLARHCIGATRWKKFEKTSIVIQLGSTDHIDLSLRTPSGVLLPLAAIPSILYSQSNTGRKSVILSDILALSFSHNALSLLKLDSLRTGTILLSGLFLYDIWWVFGTEVMLEVATTLDAPIKLLWPRSLTFSDENGFGLLGLGDVVVPGLVVALALRYDHYNAKERKTIQNGSFSKPYFWAAMGAYVLGLTMSFIVMLVFEHGQPALLYLSPACILSFVITAAIRGELPQLWSWSDEPNVREEDVGGEKTKTM